MFKKIKYIFSKTKAAFLGLLLILLPFIYLSYTSYISLTAKTDDQKNAFQVNADLIAGGIEKELSVQEEKLTEVRYSPGENHKQILRDLEAKYSMICDPFFIREDGALMTGFMSNGWDKPAKNLLGVSDSLYLEFRKAEDEEFINKDFKEAVKKYRNSLRKNNLTEDSILVLSRMARCYYKLNDFRSGIIVYHQIVRSGKYSFLIGGIPSVIAANIQIAYGYEQLNEPDNKCLAFTNLYSCLVSNPWDPITEEYKHQLTTVHRHLKNCTLSNSSTLERMKEFENSELRIFNQNEIFNSQRENIISNISTTGKDDNRIIHFISTHNDSLIQIGLYGLSKDIHFGYFLNESSIISDIIPGILKNINAGDNIAVSLLDKKNKILYSTSKNSSNNYLAVKELKNFFPDYRIALYHTEGLSISQLADNQKQQALLLFAGTIIVMILGLFIIIRSAVHELELSRMKSDFVSNVSHELKTPLSLISMFSETLGSDLQIDNNQRKQFYGIINRESDRLTHLINNVLDFSQIEESRKEYNFQLIDLSALLSETIELYRRRLVEKGFDLKINIPAESIIISADREAIQRAVLNLLSNAEKYSCERKCIEISLRKDSGSINLTIKDYGIGIPSKEQKHIFEKFYRSSNSKDIAASGTGLGLTITKYIIEQHKGEIKVDSEEGKGSKFIIFLPLVNSAPLSAN